MPAKKIDLSDPEIAVRNCLGGCGQPFISSWSGNRICDVCKNVWEYKRDKDITEHETVLDTTASSRHKAHQ